MFLRVFSLILHILGLKDKISSKDRIKTITGVEPFCEYKHQIRLFSFQNVFLVIETANCQRILLFKRDKIQMLQQTRALRRDSAACFEVRACKRASRAGLPLGSLR